MTDKPITRLEQFTEGPWNLEEGHDGSFAISVRIPGHYMVLCQRAPWAGLKEMSRANGCLIAKAPELYKSLDEMTTALQFCMLLVHDPETRRQGLEMVDTARALLKKARGS